MGAAMYMRASPFGVQRMEPLIGGANGPLAFTNDGGWTDITSSTTIASTGPNVTIPAGSLIIINVGALSTTTIATCADTAGNVYTLAVSVTSNNERLYQFYCPNSLALVAGTITVTFNATNAHKIMAIGHVANALTSSPLDKTASSTGTSTAPTVSTATTTFGNEVAVGFLGIGSSTATQTFDPDYVHDNNKPDGTWRIEQAHLILSATGIQTFNPTLSASVEWAILLATYKGF
jgi:hypothetical protein